MVLLKTTVVVLLAVACVSAANSTFAKQSQDHAELNLPVELIKPLSSGTNTTVVPPTTTTSIPSSTTTNKPSTTTSSTTITPSTTTPSNVTTQAPNVTTTSPVTPTTTHSPNVTTTTPSPNVTTVVPPTPEPSPAPSPARSWDGPSFLGGMVLAFGIVAVGFVGYRFFYLGRGGAYHTL